MQVLVTPERTVWHMERRSDLKAYTDAHKPWSSPLFRPCLCRRLHLPPSSWITLPGWQWFCQAAAAAILGAHLAFSLPGAAGLAPANSTDFVASWHHSGMRLWVITHSLHLPPSHQCSIDCRVRRFYLRCTDRPDIHAMLLFRFGRGRSEQSRTR